jgi:phage-related minor tail protein
MKKLAPIHREIMRRILAGERQCDIAADLKMREQSVSRIVNDPHFQAEIEKVEASVVVTMGGVREKIDDMADDAADYLKDALKDKNTPKSLKAKIAFFVLEAAGYGKKAEKREADVVDNGKLSEEEIHFLAESIKAAYELGTKEGEGNVGVEVEIDQIETAKNLRRLPPQPQSRDWSS